MEVVITNALIALSGSEREINRIKNEFTLSDEREAFNRSGFNAKKVKKVKFFSMHKTAVILNTGLLYDFLVFAKESGIKIKITDKRERLEYQDKKYSYEELREQFNPDFDYVEHQIKALSRMLSVNRGIIKAPTSSGKCFGIDTEILMYDGDVKKVQNILPNDIVMGWDSKPRVVKTISNGMDELYKIKYVKGGGSHIVNSYHILTLKASRDSTNGIKRDDVIDIPLKDYLLETKDFKRVFHLFQEPVLSWKENKHFLEPYYLGIWLGDSSSVNPFIYTKDSEIILYIKEYSKQFKNLWFKVRKSKNRINSYAIIGNKKSKNQITEELRRLDLIKNKHIPKEYLIDSTENRLELLAGLLDSDGYSCRGSVFEFSNKSERLSKDVLFLAKSLGFYSSINKVRKKSQNGTYGDYFIVYINGNTEIIPNKIERKKSKKRVKKKHELKDPTKVGFTVEKIGVGEYFGFTLDGDGRFMLGDFIISHNTSIFTAFCKLTNLKTLILVNKKDLGRQTYERLNEEGVPILYRDSSKRGKVNPDASYVATVGVAGDLPNDFDVVIVDECHRASSDTFQEYLSKSKAKAFYGFSATPEGNHVVDFMKVKKHLGNIIATIDIQDLIDNEVIAYPSISFVEMVMPNIPSSTDWPSVNSVCIVNNMERNEKIRELVYKHNLPTLILVRHIEHGKTLELIIPDSLFVSGENSSDFRKKAIDDFKDGKIKTLIATNIFNEGISINAIRVLIVASGGKSEIETVQRLGRALRKDEGKEEAIVYDFYDLGQKITQRHSKQREYIYNKVGFPVKILES